MPLIAALVVTMSTNAAACNTTTPASTTAASTLASMTRVSDTPPSDASGDASQDVVGRLMRLRFAEGYPTLTAEQARNAITIAQVARDLGVPRRGLQIAIATAIQESKLTNLTGGDADSGGLFQQRPSTGWGSRAQVTNPVLAARAFFGSAQHTSNLGLLDIPGWENMPLTEAAAKVQRPREDLRAEYAKWEAVAGDIADILGGDLPEGTSTSNVSDLAQCHTGDVAAITIGTLNLLGAGHTSGPDRRRGFAGWENRLPRAMSTLQNAGVSIAALQEVHRPQGRALAARYSQQWGMYPADGSTQNVVIWDRSAWRATNQRMVKIPYFGGRETPMPMVQLTSTTTGQSIWVWSIHNPADVYGHALGHRKEALRRELATMRQLTSSGDPGGADGGLQRRQGRPRGLSVRAHTHPGQRLRRVLRTVPATQEGCAHRPHLRRQPHLGQRPGRAQHPAHQGQRPPAGDRHHRRQQRRLRGPAEPDTGNYHLGAVKPELAKLVDVLAPMFDIKTVGGYRESARDPGGHPSGLAADFMVPLTRGRQTPRRRAGHLCPRPRRRARHRLHHLAAADLVDQPRRGGLAAHGGPGECDARTTATTSTSTSNPGPGSDRVDPSPTNAGCDEIVAPLPANLLGTDKHNWHNAGSHWGSWHTGTDFSVPCGTPVYAVNAGTVEVDTTQAWAGRWLVKVHTGPGALTTWYAHMRKVTVSRGAKVAGRSADRRGRRRGQRDRLPSALRGAREGRLHLRPRQRQPVDLAAPTPLPRARSEQSA